VSYWCRRGGEGGIELSGGGSTEEVLGVKKKMAHAAGGLGGRRRHLGLKNMILDVKEDDAGGIGRLGGGWCRATGKNQTHWW
jgi:hypothetical protein